MKKRMLWKKAMLFFLVLLLIFPNLSVARAQASGGGLTIESAVSEDADGGLNSVIYANGKYTAVGEAGKISQSADGIHWTRLNVPVSPSGISWRSIDFNGSTYVVAGLEYLSSGAKARLIVSTDGGVTWTDRSAAVDADILQKVRYINGAFYAVGGRWSKSTSVTVRSEDLGVIYSSADGQNWSQWSTTACFWPSGSTTSTTFFLTDIQYFNGKYVVTGNMFGGYAYLSNGTGWMIKFLPGASGLNALDFLSVYDGKLHMSHNWNEGFASSDGITFSADSSYNRSLGVVQAGSSLYRYGREGAMFSSANGGASWTPAAAVTNQTIRSAASNGTGMVLLTHSSQNLVVTPDLSKWKRIGGDLKGIAYNGNTWAISGIVNPNMGGELPDGLIASSPSGWDQLETNDGVLPAQGLTSIAYGNNLFVAAGKIIGVSADAQAWTTSDLPAGVAGPVTGLAYGPGGFVAVTANDILQSANGTSWTKATTLSGADFYNVKQVNGVYVAFGYGGVWFSTNGVSWNSLDTLVNDYLQSSSYYAIYDITYANGQYIVTATNGAEGTAHVLETTGALSSSSVWTEHLMDSDPAWPELRSIAYGNGNYVAAGLVYDVQGRTHHIAYSSTDLQNWTKYDEQALGVSGSGLNQIIYTDNKFYIAGNNSTRIVLGSGPGGVAEATPAAVIDYSDEQLTGLTANGTYTVNGTAVTADASGKLAINSSWLGTTLSIVKQGDGSATTDSAAQPLAVPVRPAAPTGVAATDETAVEGDDGTLTGVTSALEYKQGIVGAWTTVTGTSVTGLEPDTYSVRVKATSTSFASTAVQATVGAFTATPETTPAAVIDYTAEQLTGLTANGTYTVNGTAVTADANGKLAILSSWLGTTLSIVKQGDGSGTTDSAAQPLAVPVRPAAPTGVAATDETAADGDDGTLTGVTSALEYKQGTAGAWTTVTGTSVTGLEPDTYSVRVKATSTSFRSTAVQATVGAFTATPEATPAAVIDYTAEQLTGLTANGTYTVNGTSVTADANGKLAINSSWLGTTLSIVKQGDGSGTTDSAAQPLAVPVRPAAPTGVAATDETAVEGDDGTLTGVTSALEYKQGTAGAWTTVTGTSVTGLEPDTYSMRVKATSTSFASLAAQATVGAFTATPEATPAAVIDYTAEQLTGLTANGTYTVNGTAVTADASGKLAINSSWLGTTLSIVKQGDGSATTDSAAQPLAVPARPAAPAGVAATDETAAEGDGGTLTGVTSALEYKQGIAGAWTTVTGTSVTGLEPDTYSVRVKATSTSFASAAVQATVGAFTATPEATPAAVIDYTAEQLTGLTANGTYTVNGTSVTADANGKLAILSSWLGTTLSIVKQGDGSATTDSAAQPLAVPVRPAAPTGVAATDETAAEGDDGTLTGVTSALEYKQGIAGAWTTVTGTSVTGLEPDTYSVRVKATPTSFRSTAVQVTVGAFTATPETTPAAVIDYTAEQLTGLTANGTYTVNGTSVTADANGKLAILSSWLGTTLSIVKQGDGSATTDSAAQPLAVPARAAAPAGVTVTDVTYIGANNGSIQNVTLDMEYKQGSGGFWTIVEDTAVTGLTPGTYDVRLKASPTAFASIALQVTVHDSGAAIPSAPAVTADDWNNVITGLDTSMEFAVDGGPYVRYNGTNLPDLSGEHTVRVRVAASGSVPAGPDTTLIFTETAPVPASGLTVTASDPAGTANDGRTAIKVTPAPAEGNKLYYKNFGAGNAVVPNLGELLAGFALVGSDGLIPAVNGDVIGIAEVDAGGKVMKYGSVKAVVTAEPVNPVLPGTDPGNTNGGTGSTNRGTASTSTVTEVIVLVNGKQENAGTATTTTSGNVKTTVIAVDPAKLQAKLDAEGNGAVVTIPVLLDSNVFVGELDGQMIKNMENVSATLVLQTNTASYTLPAKQINIEALARQLGAGVSLEDVKLTITIGEASASMNQVISGAAGRGGFTLVAPSFDFIVTGTYGSTTVEISRFNAYVKRTVAIPDGIDPSRITTGIVVDPDGTVRHVPTRIILKDGQYYAEISSLTNSSYSVVWHPLTFADVANHWAKDAVNDMGSRMVINGVNETTFNPNADITRAEFAAIIVRGLGLKLGKGNTAFGDVSPDAWYAGAVEAASEYGLITGFEDGSFRPNDPITREQAMVMIAKAMKLTGLAERTGAADAADLLAGFQDAGSVGSWAKDGLALAFRAGLITGRSGNKLDAKSNVTRAEVAVLIQRLLQHSILTNE
ncbi:S-layer homology domain-containing protein [Paenibacillus camerounensis]|uniref:S-layer homology domain-containing protein n=1 Tax=Paenibacillus camerounensis TaxID=1243663 RepID=UPI001427C7C7|nr:S-layer homology domain-containing protein [Paenibacillus camerounensis]